VEGHDVASLGSAELSRVRKRMGFLFQNSALFDSISVGENVAFPLRRHTRMSEREILSCASGKLKEVGLAAEYDKMPAELSGGMQKRVALARAMALDPPILLVDEPSAGLDPITSSEIDALLVSRKQDRNTTLVVVTHNIPSARAIGDRLAVIHQGRLIAEGTAEELDRSEHEMVRRFMRSEGAG
jgi:phospholipid/cholesterol/gamma-HCH transport system ATP-binding protein